MIEYMYDAIRCTAGEDATLCAYIYGDEPATRSQLKLFDNEGKIIATIAGEPQGEEGVFFYSLLEEMTQGLSGRCWYSISDDGGSIQFKQPIYFI